MPDRVKFTYQSSQSYAEIELVGQYLLAAEVIRSILRPLRDEIDHLVDFGCGAGKSTRAVASCVNKGGTVTGVDISADMIREARRLTSSFPSDRTAMHFQYAQISLSSDNRERIPLNDGSADAVTSTIVFQEFQTKRQLAEAILEIARIVRPGGHFASVCVSDRITCEDFTAFSYAPFATNRSRRDNIRKCQSVVSNIVWERDRHWSRQTFTSLLRHAGFSGLSMSYPLADPSLPPFPDDPTRTWKDELQFSPFLVFCAKKP